MNAILSSALVLGLCSIVGAHDAKADPVGTWKCEYEVGGEKREATLVIKKDGDKLTGTMTYQDKQEAKLKDLTGFAPMEDLFDAFFGGPEDYEP